MATPRSAGVSSFTRSPSKASAPSEISSSPAMQRRSVDFPQPDGPTKTTNSPFSMARSMSLSACTRP